MTIKEKLDYITEVSSERQVLLITIEELSELIQVLTKMTRQLENDVTLRTDDVQIRHYLYEEIADAYVTLCQVKKKFNLITTDIDEIFNNKIERTYKKLTQNNK